MEPLKLHLRLIEAAGYLYRVVTLRPSCKARFSNNYYHDTWHLLTDLGGAPLLARLLWGLAFQRQPGTLFLLDDEHVLPTPFEGDRALPMIFSVTGQTRLEEDSLQALRRKLSRKGSPTTTVKWQTFSMEEARAQEYWRRFARDDRALWAQEHMQLRGGFICYSAPPLVMRKQALSIENMSSYLYWGTNYHYLADWGPKHRHPEGEVQVFSDFRDKVASACEARREVLEAPQSASTSEEERQKIWKKAEPLRLTRLQQRKAKPKEAQGAAGGAG